MFGNKQKDYKMATVIASNTVLDGDLQSEDGIYIEGSIHGNVSSPKSIIIGPKAFVEGNIFAESVMVSGKVKGNIEANKSLEVMFPGEVYGDIVTASLVVSEKVILEGKCSMRTEQQAPSINVSTNDITEIKSE